MRDFQNDQASGKITLVVRMGPNIAKIYQVLLVLLALGSIGQFINLVEKPILYFALLPGALLLFHLRTVMRTTDPKDFDPELKKVALSTFALSIFLFAGLYYVKHYV
jgi:1,4-dihydroxy-2-naphthoate octaprenyltransferase